MGGERKGGIERGRDRGGGGEMGEEWGKKEIENLNLKT